MRAGPSTRALLIGYAIWLLVVVGVDVRLADHRIMPILLVVPLIVLATRLNPRELLGLGALGLGLGVAIGFTGSEAGLERQMDTVFVIVLITLLSAWVATLRRRVEEALSRAQRDARHDELTGLSNRRGLNRDGARLVDDAEAASVALIDVDRFKDINDRHGHPVGDEALVEIGRRLRASVRDVDVVGRYGGEEFLVIVRGDDEASSEVIARVLAAFRAEPVHTSGGDLDVRVSVGVARVDAAGLEIAIERADAALYQSKRLGRDRSTIWRADPSPTP